jgi:hypothetical protein
MESDFIARMPINLAAKRKTRQVHIPELDMTFTLKELSARQFMQLAATTDQVAILAQMIIDDDGKRIYDSPEGMANLGELGLGPFRQLVDAATDLNGLSAKRVEEITKNGSGDRNGDSASGSPAT